MFRKTVLSRIPVSVIVVLICFVLLGCSIKWPSFKSQEAVEYFTIEYPSPSPVASKQRAGIVLVRRLQPSGTIGTDRLVAQTSIFSTEYFYYKRWAVNPASMLTDILFRDITASGLFTAVLSGPGYLSQNYELTGTLESFQATRHVKGWETELALNMIFYPYSPGSNLPDSQKIFQKRYTVTAPCHDGSGEAIVASLSTCMQKFSAELLRDLQDCLNADQAETKSPTTSESAHPAPTGEDHEKTDE